MSHSFTVQLQAPAQRLSFHLEMQWLAPLRFSCRTRKVSNRPSTLDLLQQTDHLNRRKSGFVAFIADLPASAVQSLIHGFAGDHAEGHGDAGFPRDTHDASCDLAVDIFVMAGGALDHSSQADHGTVLTGLRER